MPAGDPDGGLYGVRIASLIAGFAGSVVALSFLEQMTLWRALISVISGTACAAYVTPLAVELVHSHVPEVSMASENAVAFLIGLTAMKTVPPAIDGVTRVVARLFGAGLA